MTERKKNLEGIDIDAEHEQELKNKIKASHLAFEWAEHGQEVIISK